MDCCAAHRVREGLEILAAAELELRSVGEAELRDVVALDGDLGVRGELKAVGWKEQRRRHERSRVDFTAPLERGKRSILGIEPQVGVSFGVDRSGRGKLFRKGGLSRHDVHGLG